MSHEALGPMFAQHIADFRDRFHERGWHDPDCAAGDCANATHQFGKLLDRHGVQHEHLELDTEPDEDGEYENHFVNTVAHPKTGERHVVDWTARQFDPTADYPVIEPEKRYKKRMGMEKSTATWAGDGPFSDQSMKYSGTHNPGWDRWEKR